MFFVLINGVVWVVFDWKFFEWVGFDRLLMHPSDNELQSVIEKLQKEKDKKHLILLGDSIIWGIGINDPGNTVAGFLTQEFAQADHDDIRVVNLSVPGNSFLDDMAIVQALSDEDAVYLFFINPMLFDPYYANRNFEQIVRFKELVTDNMQGVRSDFEECCSLQIPQESFWSSPLHTLLFHSMSLYRNRDLITKKLLGLQPFVAANGLFNRILAIHFDVLFKRKPMVIGDRELPPKRSIDFSGSRMLTILSQVTVLLGNKPNVYYVILDDNMFTEGAAHRRNIQYIRDALHSTHILNLSDTFSDDLYFDTVHLKPAGHARMAQKIATFLSSFHAP